jgi:hypothetical protein
MRALNFPVVPAISLLLQVYSLISLLTLSLPCKLLTFSLACKWKWRLSDQKDVQALLSQSSILQNSVTVVCKAETEFDFCLYTVHQSLICHCKLKSSFRTKSKYTFKAH